LRREELAREVGDVGDVEPSSLKRILSEVAAIVGG
jgi:hypothetical protein